MTAEQAKRSDDICENLCKLAVRKIRASLERGKAIHIHKQQLELASLGLSLIQELQDDILRTAQRASY